MKAWLLVLAACGGQAHAADAGQDVASTESFSVPVGDACRAQEAPLCAGGFGLCVAELCRVRCNAIAYPPCAPPLQEAHFQLNGDTTCYCTAP